MRVSLEVERADAWIEIGAGETDADGRLGTLCGPSPIDPGTYRISFALEPYFASLGVEAFYPAAQIVFSARDGAQHYHVPLLLSPFGYSTYRGS